MRRPEYVQDAMAVAAAPALAGGAILAAFQHDAPVERG
jgi:hypothetical protein